MAPQTLSDWSTADANDRLETACRGRPRPRASRERRAEVIDVIRETKGRIGVATLKRSFDDVPRRRLGELVEIYRHVHPRSSDRVTWTTPAVVWAADFTELSVPIDGALPYVLSVRDLASGCHLLALPVRHATADMTIGALETLFAEHGPPLVLKTDNGSHFTAGRVGEVLDHHGVAHMRSPPATPTYNGTAEAGIGGVKLRLGRIASEAGRAGSPTDDDLERARLEGNAESTPWGPGGPTPDERWNERMPITNAERTAFQSALAVAIPEATTRHLRTRSRSTRVAPNHVALNENERATVARRAIRDTLIERGLLIIETRRTATSSTQSDGALTKN